MKKINVNKLIELKKKEFEAVDFIERLLKRRDNGFTVRSEEIIDARGKLQNIRNEFESESVKLNEAIRTVQGRAEVRKIDAQDVVCSLIEVQDYLGISKKSLKGTRVLVDCNTQKLAKSYKWAAYSTHFIGEFTPSGWCVTAIERALIHSKKFSLRMSESAKEAYLKKAETLG